MTVALSVALTGSSAVPAQLEVERHGKDHQVIVESQDHHGHQMVSDGWEGSPAGIAYSERNHHIAGFFVILMGLAELSHAFRLAPLGWMRFLLPLAMAATGLFLTVWSDHEAWPIGSLSFVQTYFGQDSEIIQHKLYGLLALAVGAVELIRRSGGMGHYVWATPLPLLAVIGGLMLFGHSHGDHPSGQKIALHHAIMGTMAMTAGSSKLLAGWGGGISSPTPSRWEVVWAALILLIGIQLLIYSE